MKTLKPIVSTEASSSEAVLQQIRDALYDLNAPGEAQYVRLYQALLDEHQNAIDQKEQEMAEIQRRMMINAHLILSLAYPDSAVSNPPGAGTPQTIRALIKQREDQE